MKGVIDQPTLRTSRLILRPFTVDDAVSVELLAGAREVADTTMHLPHPYPSGAAEQWIATHPGEWDAGTCATFAITDAGTGQLFGAIALTIAAAHARGELGYWIGLPFWNRGYCTEAGIAMLELGFETLGLHRIQARHLTRNPASGRVMQKLAMQPEGVHRHGMRKNDRFEDLAIYAILSDEWASGAGT